MEHDEENIAELKRRLKELADYRIAIAPILLRNKVYVCGKCGKRINRKHNYCHMCGQRQLKS